MLKAQIIPRIGPGITMLYKHGEPPEFECLDAEGGRMHVWTAEQAQSFAEFVIEMLLALEKEKGE